MIKKIGILLLLSVTSCGVFKPSIPQPRTEFRGFWVATVVNIDWPTRGNDVLEKQKSDYLKILDFYHEMNFNAAIVQIRTAGDAFYLSKYAPWSRFLTGKEGKAPNTKIDILEWMINETHKRGMEFHAWLNPYRATVNLKTEILSSTHDFNTHPEWMLKYGQKFYYDPGLPEVRQRLISIMDEVVSNYDVDAIHFDDYFYPYKIKDEVFQDASTYSYYALPDQSLDDWRRSNVDSLIKNIHKTIKKKKPWVQFGVSPFGVWKNKSTDPKGSDTKAGQTTYEDLYADPLLWMKKGWLDYLVPQVYWSMELPVASHRKIVAWWENNTQNTNLYIGNGAYKIRNNKDTSWENKKELPAQVTLARKTNAVQGNVFFSAQSLMKKNSDVVKHLKKKYYRRIALPPVSPFAPTLIDPVLKLESAHDFSEFISLNFKGSDSYRFVMVYASGKKLKPHYPIKKLLTKTVVEKGNSIRINKKQLKNKKHLAFTFINRFGQESEPIIIHLNQIH